MTRLMCKTDPRDAAFASAPATQTRTHHGATPSTYTLDLGASIGLPTTLVRWALAYFFALFVVAPVLCTGFYVFCVILDSAWVSDLMPIARNTGSIFLGIQSSQNVTWTEAFRGGTCFKWAKDLCIVPVPDATPLNKGDQLEGSAGKGNAGNASSAGNAGKADSAGKQTNT